MAAPSILSWVCDETRSHRVHVDIDQQLLKVSLRIDQLGFVSPLPKRPEYSLTGVDTSRRPLLKTTNRTLQRNLANLSRQVKMVPQANPHRIPLLSAAKA